MSRDQDDEVKRKLALLRLAETLGNVSQACEIMGVSRDSFYRFQKRYETGGELALRNRSRRKALPKNRVDASTEQAVLDIAIDRPWCSATLVAEELMRTGVRVSAGGVRSIWARHDLETYEKRLSAARHLTGGPSAAGRALECADLLRPGSLCAVNVQYVGDLRFLGSIYQYIFIDVYSRVARVGLRNRSAWELAREILRNDVLPWYRSLGIRMQRIAVYTKGEKMEDERGSNDENLPAFESPRSRSEAALAQEVCQCFLRTIENEFYALAFRSIVYREFPRLHYDVKAWLTEYNERRPQSRRYCFRRTPLQTLMSDIDAFRDADARET